MSPLMQATLESKNERRKRLMALPYPEKVRMVEQMRAAVREIQQATRHKNDSTIAVEVEKRFEAFKAGRERGLSHDCMFAALRTEVGAPVSLHMQSPSVGFVDAK